MGTKTVGEKLFLKKGKTIQVLSAPDDFAEIIGKHDATLASPRSKQPADVVLVFARNRGEMEAGLERARKLVAPDGALWLAYPKGTSKLKADIHRDSIREYAATVGLNTVSLIAINDIWSCIRLKIES